MADKLTPQRQFGKTGIRVPLLGYGTAPLGKPDVGRELGIHCLNHAIDRGITYIDTSPDYGSEPVVGEVMRARREEVFLATKVNMRRRDSVLRELEVSLSRLRTDHVDLIQVHAVNSMADLDQALAWDGTLAALETARDRGMAYYIGITGHARPELLAEALRRYPFDSVLCALGMADHMVSAPETFLLPEARKRGTAVIAMKVFGHGEYVSRDLALRFSLELPGVTLAILGLKSVREIDEAVKTALSYRPLSDGERTRLIEEVRPLVEQDAEDSEQGRHEGKSALFWLHDTKVLGWQRKDEPYTVRY